MLDQSVKNQILQGIRKEEYDYVMGLVHSLEPSDIASLLESIKFSERKNILERISDHTLAQAIPELSSSVCGNTFEQLSNNQVKNIIGYLEADDLAEFLNTLPDTARYRILDSMNALNRQIVEEILSFPEDSAGRMMNTDFISVHPDASVRTIIRYLKFRSPLPQNSDSIFIVNEKHIFLGVVKIADLITTDKNYNIRILLEDEKHAVDPNSSQDELIDLFVKQNLLSAPVVDENDRLIGRITVDDVLDVSNERANQALMVQGINSEEDIFAPVLKNTRKRMIWLGINLLTAFLAALVIKNFESTIQSVVALAVLLPIISSMGGIAGSQALIVTIRGISSKTIDINNLFSFLSNELIISFLNALFWALVVTVICYFWLNQPLLSFIAGISIIVNIIFGAISGVVLPWVLKSLNIDPAIAGSVVLTTITDITGFFIILSLGSILL